MSLWIRADEMNTTRLHELRRFQVYRLERPRRRPILQRLRRGVMARLPR